METRRDFFRKLAGKKVETPPAGPSIALNYASCLAWNQTMCYSCKEACMEDAIQFNGLFKPVILEEKCTYCGDCAPVCPVASLTVIPGPKEETCESSS